jgi:hypothetical protein
MSTMAVQFRPASPIEVRQLLPSVGVQTADDGRTVRTTDGRSFVPNTTVLDGYCVADTDGVLESHERLTLFTANLLDNCSNTKTPGYYNNHRV